MDEGQALSILRLTRNPGAEGIKAAFRQLCFATHPDRYPGTREQFIQILAAYRYLLQQNKPGAHHGVPCLKADAERVRGRDLYMTLRLDHHDAHRGGIFPIRHPLNGSSLWVRVPKRVKTGATIRLSSCGGSGLRGGEAGDLLIWIEIIDPPQTAVNDFSIGLVAYNRRASLRAVMVPKGQFIRRSC